MYIHGIGGGPLVAVVSADEGKQELFVCLNFNLHDAVEEHWYRRFSDTLFQGFENGNCSVTFAEWGLTVTLPHPGKDATFRMRDAVVRALRTHLPPKDADFKLLTGTELLVMQFDTIH